MRVSGNFQNKKKQEKSKPRNNTHNTSYLSSLFSLKPFHPLFHDRKFYHYFSGFPDGVGGGGGRRVVQVPQMLVVEVVAIPQLQLIEEIIAIHVGRSPWSRLF